VSAAFAQWSTFQPNDGANAAVIRAAHESIGSSATPKRTRASAAAVSPASLCRNAASPVPSTAETENAMTALAAAQSTRRLQVIRRLALPHLRDEHLQPVQGRIIVVDRSWTGS
jgi:hypothetical protein